MPSCTATVPCVGSSSVIPLAFAEILTSFSSASTATLTSDGPAGACGFLNLYTVPASFTDQPEGGRWNDELSPLDVATRSVAPNASGLVAGSIGAGSFVVQTSDCFPPTSFTTSFFASCG